MICFAHISDLHFGSKMITGGWQVWLQSPHHLAKCLALPAGLMSAIDDANLEDEDELRVVASGDLTVSGTADELAIAHSYMRSRPTFSRLGAPFGSIGLNLPPDRLGIVPGNHDHWNGQRLPVPLGPYNANLYPEQFRETPWSKVWKSTSSNTTLEIFGVDSNSGWAPNLPNTIPAVSGGLFAQGKISNAAFLDLEQKLKASYSQANPIVRAIICHHSLSFQSGRYLPTTLELDQASRDQLLDLAGKYHVAAILTGHTHDSSANTFQRTDLNKKLWHIKELRCASTFSPDKPNEERGFLMNRITDNGGGSWDWSVWKYAWDGTAFVSTPASPWNNFNQHY